MVNLTKLICFIASFMYLVAGICSVGYLAYHGEWVTAIGALYVDLLALPLVLEFINTLKR